jgi:large subunit ribosomal protein L6
MSRIGKLPITIPSGVTVAIQGTTVTVKGAKGELKRTLHSLVKIESKDNTIIVTTVDNSRLASGLWGLSRTLIANMITGVTAGYSKQLAIKGVGFKMALKGKDLDLALGFSHPVAIKAPEGITFAIDPKSNIITVTGMSKEAVGQIASNIRSKRPPEPYLGKGIMYVGEHIIRKAGKTAAGAGAKK